MKYAPRLIIALSAGLVIAGTPALADLVAYYPLDGDFQDASGNGNHGTLTDANWITATPPVVGETTGDDELIEQLTVLATQYQSIESAVLEDGVDYYLRVTGTYSYTSSNCLDGAFYCDSNTPDRVWTWNSSNSQRPCPDVYNSDNIYYYYFTGDGTSEQFGFVDNGGYGDNSGSLTIQIWQRNVPDVTWHVSTAGSNQTGDGSVAYPLATIQAGINAASNGDTVLIQAGTYTENIGFGGKNGLLGNAGEDR